MRILFDMDGTIANLYGVNNWLDYLTNSNTYPYEKARPLVNMQLLARLLNKLQKNGYEIGVISWLAKNSTKDYDTRVTNAKKKWLETHLKSVQWDFVEIVPYGTNKNLVCKNTNDILFDDEIGNRTIWNGVAYDVNNIIEILKTL